MAAPVEWKTKMFESESIPEGVRKFTDVAYAPHPPTEAEWTDLGRPVEEDPEDTKIGSGLCCAEGSDTGYGCTQKVGHVGPHRARTEVGGRVCAEWPRRDLAPIDTLDV